MIPGSEYGRGGGGEGGLWPVAKVPPKISKADNEQKLALGEGATPVAKVPPKKSFG